MSLQSKIFLFFAILLGLIMFEWVFFTNYEERVFKEEMSARGRILVRALAELSKDPILSYRITQLEKQIDSIQHEKDVVYARIYNANYLVLAASDRKWEGWFFSGSVVNKTTVSFADNFMIVKTPIRILNNTWGMAEIVFSLSTMREKIDKSRQIFLIIFIIELFLAMGFAIFLELQVVKPLNDLSKQVKAITPQSLRDPTVVYKYSAQEITEVVSSINDMKKKLKIAQEELVSKTQMATFVQIAKNVAHEVRNPLEAISGAVEVISGERGISTLGRDSLSIIREEIQNLNDYLSKFLELTRPEPLTPMEVNINDVIGDCILLMKPVFRKRRIDILWEGKEKSFVCRLDVNQIKRVIINVLLNSVEAIESDGIVSIKVGMDKEYLRLIVSDTGRGIEPENIKKVFEPYFTTKREGSGIGLSLSKSIIEEHGGKIKIRSIRGRGTEVEIYLPLNRRMHVNG